ncbi:hypothetical protein GCM10028784_29830 [Myceligenerans cantabricum]
MSVIALCSASGAPGVTTTAVGLALLWPRPVLLVEADPAGGSILAGWFRGQREYTHGLLDLAFTALPVDDALRDVAQPLWQPADGPGPALDAAVSEARFVAGLRSHAQAAALRDLWQPLADALAGLEETGQDVIVDAGRLGHPGPRRLLSAADLTLLVTTGRLPALAHARGWVDTVTAADGGSLGEAAPWPHQGVLLIGAGDPYPAREVSKVLGLPVVAGIARDPDGAAVYSDGARPPRRFANGSYVRSLRAAAAGLIDRVEADRRVLGRPRLVPPAVREVFAQGGPR